jgi:hypothetical protein
MLLLYSAVFLAVIAANMVAILLAATIAYRRMHHDYDQSSARRPTCDWPRPCRSRSGSDRPRRHGAALADDGVALETARETLRHGWYKNGGSVGYTEISLTRSRRQVRRCGCPKLAQAVAAVVIALFWCINSIAAAVGITTLATAVGAATNPAEAGDKDRRRRYRKQGRGRHRRYRGGKWEWYWAPYWYWEGPYYGGPYGNPQYPQYQNPQYEDPQYQDPQYQDPQYQDPPY